MSDQPRYEVLKEFENWEELQAALQGSNHDDRRHALLNVADSDVDGETALRLFLQYINDPNLSFTAYQCIDLFLETCRSFPLALVLPTIINGIDSEEPFIRSHCENALKNLISPGKITDEAISFESFQSSFDPADIHQFLDSNDPEKIILGLLYIYHHPHSDPDIFNVIHQPLAKKIKAVSCLAGCIIDNKLCKLIEDLQELSEISLSTHQNLVSLGLSRAGWIYDRYDEIQGNAKEQMDNFRQDTRNFEQL